MEPTTITPHEFNLAEAAFYDHPDDSALNEQGNRREKLRAALGALGITVETKGPIASGKVFTTDEEATAIMREALSS